MNAWQYGPPKKISLGSCTCKCGLQVVSIAAMEGCEFVQAADYCTCLMAYVFLAGPLFFWLFSLLAMLMMSEPYDEHTNIEMNSHVRFRGLHGRVRILVMCHCSGVQQNLA